MPDDEDDNAPMLMRAPLVVHQHRTMPASNSKMDEIYEMYPILREPSLVYANQTEKEIQRNTSTGVRYIWSQYASGRKRHTMSDRSDRILAEWTLRQKASESKNGFAHKESNSGTLNQNQTVTEYQRKRGGSPLNPRSWGRS
jgi:hypothetical protein